MQVRIFIPLPVPDQKCVTHFFYLNRIRLFAENAKRYPFVNEELGRHRLCSNMQQIMSRKPQVNTGKEVWEALYFCIFKAGSLLGQWSSLRSETFVYFLFLMIFLQSPS